MPATIDADIVALRAEALVIFQLTRRPDGDGVKSQPDTVSIFYRQAL